MPKKQALRQALGNKVENHLIFSGGLWHLFSSFARRTTRPVAKRRRSSREDPEWFGGCPLFHPERDPRHGDALVILRQQSSSPTSRSASSIISPDLFPKSQHEWPFAPLDQCLKQLASSFLPSNARHQSGGRFPWHCVAGAPPSAGRPRTLTLKGALRGLPAEGGAPATQCRPGGRLSPTRIILVTSV